MPAPQTVTPSERGLDPTSYEVRETHTGLVFLAGGFAYKAKKPIVTDFLDFRAADERERVCEREVLLNRRLAPQSYLGVGHFMSPDGTAPEPVVVMHRYHDRIRLRSMVERGEPVERHLGDLAEHLATFHAGAERSPDIDDAATVARIAERWQENLSELSRLGAESGIPTGHICEARRLSMSYIAGRKPLFDARIDAKRIVDGHGDLLADDIFCASSGPVPLDCLEFDDRLRYIDGLDDAAFLAMDLEFLDRRDLSVLFLDSYRRAAQDDAPQSLAHFYIAYRAVVRAKVDCIRMSQGRGGADDDARRHLDVALDHLQAATARLILIGGGPGSGKSTLAAALRESLDAEVISTDVVRRELQQSGALSGSAGDVDGGLYTPGNVARVYAVVLERAAGVLARGRSVILDGTWRDPRQRQKAMEVAQRSSAALVEIACQADLSLSQHRIGTRGPTSSDATAAIAAEITAAPWPGAHTVDTSRPLAESVAEAQRICCLAF
ncbi:hypothetical protein BCA37_16870 [Mycobacterium sp. djl-10]|nr:hypothetical protein BCA37_16870 [Mycobacterium sp. djl-10]